MMNNWTRSSSEANSSVSMLSTLNSALACRSGNPDRFGRETRLRTIHDPQGAGPTPMLRAAATGRLLA